ncbi:MAG TPA: DUF59 domain-containing protein [Bacteroidales bacterium]|nr:DUF59 domain-containing protein [Bacteroidales bacterium]
MSDMELEQNIKRALKQVYDPEIPVNIVDLGLVYDISIGKSMKKGRDVNVTMTLTAPNCPLADEVVENARIAVSQVPGVGQVSVRLTFDPPWDPSRMSEEALLDTGLYGMY